MPCGGNRYAIDIVSLSMYQSFMKATACNISIISARASVAPVIMLRNEKKLIMRSDVELSVVMSRYRKWRKANARKIIGRYHRLDERKCRNMENGLNISSAIASRWGLASHFDVVRYGMSSIHCAYFRHGSQMKPDAHGSKITPHCCVWDLMRASAKKASTAAIYRRDIIIYKMI